MKGSRRSSKIAPAFASGRPGQPFSRHTRARAPPGNAAPHDPDPRRVLHLPAQYAQASASRKRRADGCTHRPDLPRKPIRG